MAALSHFALPCLISLQPHLQNTPFFGGPMRKISHWTASGISSPLGPRNSTSTMWSRWRRREHPQHLPNRDSWVSTLHVLFCIASHQLTTILYYSQHADPLRDSTKPSPRCKVRQEPSYPSITRKVTPRCALSFSHPCRRSHLLRFDPFVCALPSSCKTPGGRVSMGLSSLSVRSYSRIG